jgi:hypothetical protein
MCGHFCQTEVKNTLLWTLGQGVTSHLPCHDGRLSVMYAKKYSSILMFSNIFINTACLGHKLKNKIKFGLLYKCLLWLNIEWVGPPPSKAIWAISEPPSGGLQHWSHNLDGIGQFQGTFFVPIIKADLN